MSDNRRIFTDNEKLILFSEVNGNCPICGDKLTHTKKSKIYKKFEIAHIYPANPTTNEYETLAGCLLLDEDVNSLRNVLAVCPVCHTIFDNPRTLEEYNRWYILKKKLLDDAELRSTYYLFNVETEVDNLLKKLNDEDIEIELIPLNYTSLKVDEKADETLPYAIKRAIKNDVVDYFDFIRNQFKSMNEVTPRKFETLATQIKLFYLKCCQTQSDQSKIFVSIVEWLDTKTDNYSKRACEIVVAFFIQDCEVFS